MYQTYYFPSIHLPYLLRQKLQQVINSTQAPHDLAATTALAMASFAAQYLIDVEREGGGTSSVALNVMILAESGARKTTVASHFLGPVREFEKNAATRTHQAQLDFESDFSTWDAKRKGILAEIRERARAGEGADEFDGLLRDLDRQKPEPPIHMRGIYQDFTPEGLLQGIATKWPSAAIISDEASGLLRGRSFGDLALLNKLWDGEHAIRTRIGEHIPLRWPTRLTTLLMVQPGEFARFLSKRGDAAWDIGSLARTLICSPVSTLGGRFINPQGGVSIDASAYEERVHQLLELTYERISSGTVQRDVMRMSFPARQRWICFYNAIEERLGPGRDLQHFSAFGSKIAENALRIAAVLQYFGTGALEISDGMMQAGVEIAAYFLWQHQQIFAVPSAQHNLSDAQFLLGWLQQKCAITGLRAWQRSYLLKNLPYALRKHGRGRAALYALLAQGWLFLAPPPPQGTGKGAYVCLSDRCVSSNTGQLPAGQLPY